MINDEIIPKADNEHNPSPHKNINTEQMPEMLHSYVDMEFALPRGLYVELFHSKVKQCAVYRDGKPIGVETSNPITNTRLYEVEYFDGTVDTLATNVIAENILLQVDKEGQRQLLMDKIIYHQ